MKKYNISISIIAILLFWLIELYRYAFNISLPTAPGYILLSVLFVKNFYLANSFVWKEAFSIRTRSVYFLPFLLYFLFSVVASYYPKQGFISLLAVTIVFFVVLGTEVKQIIRNRNFTILAFSLSGISAIFILSNIAPLLTKGIFVNHLGGFNGLVGNSANMGFATAISLMFLISFLFRSKEKTIFNLVIDIGVFFLIAVANVMVIATYSRSAYLNILVFYIFLVIYLVFAFSKVLSNPSRMLPLIFISAIGLLFTIFFDFANFFHSFSNTFLFEKDFFTLDRLEWVYKKTIVFFELTASDEDSRISLFLDSFQLLSKDPINLFFGYGPGFIDSTSETTSLYRDAGYIGFALDVGLVGIILMGIFALRYIIAFFKIFSLCSRRKIYMPDHYVILLLIPFCLLLDPGKTVLYTFASPFCVIIYLLMGITIEIETRTKIETRRLYSVFR